MKTSIQPGKRFKIENTFLDGVYSKEVFQIITVLEDNNEVFADNLTTGVFNRRFLFHTDEPAQRCLVNSLERGKTLKTGFIFSMID